MNKKQYVAHLHIRRLDTREIVKSIGLSSIQPRYVEKVMRGLLRNMGPDYYVDDSETDQLSTYET